MQAFLHTLDLPFLLQKVNKQKESFCKRLHFKPYKTLSESYSLSMLCTGFQWGVALLQTHIERGIKSESNGSDRLYPTCVVWTHHLTEESVLN